MYMHGFSQPFYCALASQIWAPVWSRSWMLTISTFWRSPSHGAKPLGLTYSQSSSHQGAQARPAHPPPPCTVPQTYKSGSPAVSGGGEGQGWCCWAHPGTKIWNVETQGLARATQPTSRSETWQAGQANFFVGAYKFW
jgi:hypothetical protein